MIVSSLCHLEFPLTCLKGIPSPDALMQVSAQNLSPGTPAASRDAHLVIREHLRHVVIVKSSTGFSYFPLFGTLVHSFVQEDTHIL